MHSPSPLLRQIFHFEAENGSLQQISHQEQAVPTKDLFLLINGYSNKPSLDTVLVTKCKGSYFKYWVKQMSFCIHCISYEYYHKTTSRHIYVQNKVCPGKKSYVICFFAVSHTPEPQLPLRQLTEISSNQCAVVCGKNIMLIWNTEEERTMCG